VDVAVDVGVASAPDLDRLEAVTLDVARDVMRRVPGGVPEFEPARSLRAGRRAAGARARGDLIAGAPSPAPHACASPFPKSILG
jgi:hypothetical protein